MLEKVVIGGDLSKMQPAERMMYYRSVCESLGLNPLTRPFQYISLQNKLTLYATKDCTEQLRKLHGVSTVIVSREVVEGVYVVTARATDHQGRSDESIGAVHIEGLKGEARANAMMKAETKAKRRVTLSVCGMGFVDESETDSIPGAAVVHVDQDTGEIIEPERPKLTYREIIARWGISPEDWAAFKNFCESDFDAKPSEKLVEAYDLGARDLQDAYAILNSDPKATQEQRALEAIAKGMLGPEGGSDTGNQPDPAPTESATPTREPSPEPTTEGLPAYIGERGDGDSHVPAGCPEPYGFKLNTFPTGKMFNEPATETQTKLLVTKCRDKNVADYAIKHLVDLIALKYELPNQPRTKALLALSIAFVQQSTQEQVDQAMEELMELGLEAPQEVAKS